MAVSLIAAMSPDRVIGRDGKIPWYYREDLAYFKAMTEGNTVIMGRHTWLSLPPKVRPLPNRQNLIVSTTLRDEGCHPTLESALAAADRPPWIIGGARLYREGLRHAQSVHLTIVPDRPPIEGSVLFPELGDEWVVQHEKNLGGPLVLRIYQRSAP